MTYKFTLLLNVKTSIHLTEQLTWNQNEYRFSLNYGLNYRLYLNSWKVDSLLYKYISAFVYTILVEKPPVLGNMIVTTVRNQQQWWELKLLLFLRRIKRSDRKGSELVIVRKERMFSVLVNIKWNRKKKDTKICSSNYLFFSY